LSGVFSCARSDPLCILPFAYLLPQVAYVTSVNKLDEETQFRLAKHVQVGRCRLTL